jgi:Ni/Co efflux regulator RcnB
MFRRITAALLLVAVGLAAGCSNRETEDPAEAAYKEARKALRATDDEGEKAALAEEYLARFPDTKHSGFVAETIAYYRGERLQQPQRVHEVLTSALERIEEPQARFEVSMALFPFSHEVGEQLDLAAIADELAAHRALGYDEHSLIMEAAEAEGLWPLVEQHATGALALATEEAFRAQYEGREFTDEQVASYSRQRQVNALAYKGWALCYLGRDEDCFSLFEEAAPLNEESYVGVPYTPLNVFWGKALAQRGEYEQAMKLLLPDATFGDTTNALPTLRKTYAALNGDDGTFEEFLWSARQETARDVDDLTLPDYDGTPHTLSNFKGDVVLLAFWFPT